MADLKGAVEKLLTRGGQFKIEDASNASDSRLWVKPGKNIVIEGTKLESFTVKPRESIKNKHGVESAELMTEGKRLPGSTEPNYLPLNTNLGEEFPTHLIKAVRFKIKTGVDAAGNDVYDPKPLILRIDDDLTFKKPDNIPPVAGTSAAPGTRAPNPNVPPPIVPTTPLGELNDRAKNLVVVNVKAKERRVYDLVQKTMENTRGFWRTMLREHTLERHRQFYSNLLDSAQTPFAEKSIRLAEQKARQKYDNELANERLPLQRTARRVWEGLKFHLKGETRIERYTKEFLTTQADTDIKDLLKSERAAFDEEKKQVAGRFDAAFDNQALAINQGLGEKFLDVTGGPIGQEIKNLVGRYMRGGFVDDAAYKRELGTLFNRLKSTHPDLLGDAQEYADTLEISGKQLKTEFDRRIQHHESTAALDDELNRMRVALGVGTMGEATQIKQTDTSKAVTKIKEFTDTLVKKNIIGAALINEATVATSVSFLLSLKVLPQMAIGSSARVTFGLLGGGAVGGFFARWREKGRLQSEYWTYLGEREAGVKTPDTAKRRKWFERHDVIRRTASDLVGGMKNPLYTPEGRFKDSLTDEEIRTGLAHLADSKARLEISSREKNRIGMIELGGVGGQERARTTVVTEAARVEKDLKDYVSRHADVKARVFGGQEYDRFLHELTGSQRTILDEGHDFFNRLADPAIKLTLTPVSGYTPELEIFRRRFRYYGAERAIDSKKIEGAGIQQILQEFGRQVDVESTRHGVKAGAFGMAIGALFQEVAMDFQHWQATGQGGLGHGALLQGARELLASSHIIGPDAPPAILPELHDIHNGILQLSDNLRLDQNGSLDIVQNGHIVHGDFVDSSHIQFDAHHNLTQQSIDYIKEQADKFGFDTTAATDPLHVAAGGTHSFVLGGQNVQAPDALHWVDNADGTSKLVLQVQDSSGHTFDRVLADHILVGPDGPKNPESIIRLIKDNGLLDFQPGQEIPGKILASLSEKLPGFHDFVDVNGVHHAIQAAIPDGTHLVPQGNGVFDLADKDNTTLLHGMNFDDHGHLTNQSSLLAEAAKNHVSFGPETATNIVSPGGGDTTPLNLRVGDMGPTHGMRGFWGWAENPINADTSIDHPLAGTNAVKNLFRTYEETIMHSTNVTGAPGHFQFEIPDLKINYNNMQADVSFNNLPFIFREHFVNAIGKLTNEAIKMHEVSGVPLDQMDRLHGILYHAGRIGGLVGKDDFNFVVSELEKLGSRTDTIYQAQIIQQLMDKLPGSITLSPNSLLDNIISLIPRPEDQIPIPVVPFARRDNLEPGVPGTKSGRDFPSGSAYYQASWNLTPEMKTFYQNRLSERIKSNPNAFLDPAVEIPDYFSRQDSAYIQELETYLAQDGMKEPMDPNTDAVVAIPVYSLGEGKVVQIALDQYLLQIDKTRNKQAIDPKKFEVVVFLNHPKPKREELEAKIGRSYTDGAEARVRAGNPEAYDTEEVIRQFKQKHPELRIRVMKKEFDQRPLWGSIIKPLYDASLLRFVKRGTPIVKDPTIITNDIDLVKMSPTYLRDILQQMDLNEIQAWRDPSVQKIDAMVGHTDMAQEGYDKYPGFLVSQRLWNFLELQNRGNHSTQGRNTMVRGSTYSALGGANPRKDDGADGELGLMINLARNNNTKTTPFLYKAWLQTDPRREFDTWRKGIPFVYNWNTWAAMHLYGQNWKDHFNQPPQDPSQIDKTFLETEINEIAKQWYSGINDGYIFRALDFIGLRNHQMTLDRAFWRGIKAGSPKIQDLINTVGLMSGEYHEENGRIIVDKKQGHTDYHIEGDKIVIDDLSNVVDRLRKYSSEKRWVLSDKKVQDALKSPPTSTVGKYNIEYLDYEEFDGLYGEIFTGKDYEWKPPSQAPTIIDLGAHIGMSVFWWKNLAPGAKITAVEANPKTSDLLKKNIHRNKLSDVSVIKGAVSSKNVPVDLYMPKPGVDFRWGDFVGGRPVDQSKYDVAQVPAVKLSDLITGPVDLLKLDIEGSELEVLKEAESKLSQVKELMMEFHNDPANPANSYQEMMDLLNRQGYIIESTKYHGKPIDPATLDLTKQVFVTIHARRP